MAVSIWKSKGFTRLLGLIVLIVMAVTFLGCPVLIPVESMLSEQ